MASLRKKSQPKRAKVVKVLPGEDKPSRFQVFQKKKTMEKQKPVKKETVIEAPVSHYVWFIFYVLEETRPATSFA